MPVRLALVRACPAIVAINEERLAVFDVDGVGCRTDFSRADVIRLRQRAADSTSCSQTRTTRQPVLFNTAATIRSRSLFRVILRSQYCEFVFGNRQWRGQ